MEKIKTKKLHLTNAKKFVAAEWYAIKLLFSSQPVLAVLYMLFFAISYPVSLVNIFLWKEVLDALTEEYSGSDTLESIILLVALYLAITLIITCVNKVNFGVIRPILYMKSQKKLDELIMKKMSELDLSFFDAPSNQDMLQVAQNSKQEVSDAMTYFIREIISAVTFFVALGYFLSIEPAVGCAYLLTGIPSVIINHNATVKMDRFSIKSVPENRVKDYYRSLLTTDSYAKDLRLYNLRTYWLEKYQNIWNKLRAERTKIFTRGVTLSSISLLLSVIGSVLIVGYSSYSVLCGGMTIGTLTMFLSFAEKSDRQFRSLCQSVPKHIKVTIPHILRFTEFISLPSQDAMGEEPIEHTPPYIEFQNVSFHYPNDDRNVLQNLNLTIAPGKKVLLVGKNGAGKTTIVKLLLRFYRPTEGQILINGKNIESYSQKELYRIFSVCFQDIIQYAMTMRENITISNINRINDIDGIQKAAHTAEVDTIYESFSEGLDADLTRNFSSKGYVLSGGQWQKVSLSRAFFRDSAFMIFDEPSSALDPDAENFVFESIKSLCQNKGGLIISHRLTAVPLADFIIFLKDGKISESGTHQELIEQNGEYAYMYRLQADKYRPKEDCV